MIDNPLFVAAVAIIGIGHLLESVNKISNFFKKKKEVDLITKTDLSLAIEENDNEVCNRCEGHRAAMYKEINILKNDKADKADVKALSDKVETMNLTLTTVAIKQAEGNGMLAVIVERTKKD